MDVYDNYTTAELRLLEEPEYDQERIKQAMKGSGLAKYLDY